MKTQFTIAFCLGQNALTLASYAGCIDCVKLLLTKWTYKDYTEASILPPLCVAAMKGHLDIVNYFCQRTPRPTTIQSAHGEIVDLFSTIIFTFTMTVQFVNVNNK